MGLYTKRVKTQLSKYGLEAKNIIDIDLRECYPQYRPKTPVDKFFVNTMSMQGSPHVEIAKMYFEKGRKWLIKNFRDLRYFAMKKYLKSDMNIIRLCNLCDSLKNGYLCKNYHDQRIVVLDEPISKTRYGVNVDTKRVPEVWSGHHRVGILIALGLNINSVLVAYDNKPMSKKCTGKFHKEFCL